MERDFLGLSTNNSSPIIIKQEINDPCHESVPQRGTGSQWFFPDSVLDSPHAVSSKSHSVGRPMRYILDRVPSPGFMTTSTSDNHSQGNIINKQGSSPLRQSDFQPVYHREGLKLHSFANNQYETTSSAMNYSFLQSRTVLKRQHMGRCLSNSLSFGSIAPPCPTLSVPSPIRYPYTDTRSSSKPLTAPAQMTIFYAGSVSVYDNISPDKAQAIMLLAGNGSSTTPACVISSSQLQATYTKPTTNDIACIRNPSPTTSSPALASQVSILHIPSPSGGVSNQRRMTSSQQLPEPSREVYSQRLSVGYAVPGPVPQARKASLARFLERRKERVTNSQPYQVKLKSSEQEHNMSSTSDGLSFTLRSPI